MIIRKAIINDIEQIHSLLNYFADKGLLLPRSLSELYDHLRDFTVAQESPEGGTIIGVCGLGICWKDLAEVKSLAVLSSFQGKRTGQALVKACLDEARSLGIKRVFTLTYVPDFFRRFGFEQVDKSQLPHKVWADCVKCPKFPDCDEVAMIKYL